MSEKEKCERILYLKECVAWALSLSGLTAVIKRYYWGLRGTYRRWWCLRGSGATVKAYMCVCFLKCGAEERGETSVLSLGRIIYGSFAAFLPSMTSRLQDVASAADPVLSGCISRQGPASPSGPAPRLTDDNTATLCLCELWEKNRSP